MLLTLYLRKSELPDRKIAKFLNSYLKSYKPINEEKYILHIWGGHWGLGPKNDELIREVFDGVTKENIKSVFLHNRSAGAKKATDLKRAFDSFFKSKPSTTPTSPPLSKSSPKCIILDSGSDHSKVVALQKIDKETEKLFDELFDENLISNENLDKFFIKFVEQSKLIIPFYLIGSSNFSCQTYVGYNKNESDIAFICIRKENKKIIKDIILSDDNIKDLLNNDKTIKELEISNYPAAGQTIFFSKSAVKYCMIAPSLSCDNLTNFFVEQIKNK